ncbi:MAG: DUF1972 domain-containing protein [Erysipelotrichia bacterium]|nr:DUF1972 domain-containing protein [Erysipelotrichia bacterium]
MKNTQHIFLVGAKSLGAYGGYETFINKLTEYHQNDARIQYHVACKGNGDGCMNPFSDKDAKIINENEFIYHNARCFRVKIPEKLGAAQAIYYDCAALKKCIQIIKNEQICKPIVYIMACRIGPFMKGYYKQIRALGGSVFLNPDGHEWMRAKWPPLVRKYWKLSEKIMVKYSDLCICDSITIEKYIHDCYDGKGILGNSPQTTFIAYGAETRKSHLEDSDKRFVSWLQEKGLERGKYYLVVGRFVPENNYETMIQEFMKSESKKNLAIITNVNERFLNELEEKLHFNKDKRIRFTGTVYDQELLMKIRENAFAYLHGHEVGGTNPSLLEALGSTKLNLLLNVGFNREVAELAALYWSKEPGDLAMLINEADQMSNYEIEKISIKARQRIESLYSWQYICDRYAEVFLR